MSNFDVAIAGSGFAGAILARILCRLGYRTLLLEKGQHPRFALGESTTPLANLTLERLARKYALPELFHLSTYGRWQQHLPQLRGGLKRGFSFFQHQEGQPYRNSATNEARLLVAASADDHHADTHWLRQDVDQFLVETAAADGVTYCDRTLIDEVRIAAQGVRLAGERQGRRQVFTAAFLIDATGPGGLLARALPIPRQAVKVHSALLYSHFAGLPSWVELAREAGAVFPPGPYPDESAAVHHLLADRGWLYALPFAHGVTSAGIVLRHGRRHPGWERIAGDPAQAFHHLLAPFPTLAAQFAAARAVLPVRFVPRLQFRLARAAGPRFFLLPHTYAFFEPLFSPGIAWSLLAVERLAGWFAGDSSQPPDRAARAYGLRLRAEADQIERLMRAAYLSFGHFTLLTAVSFLYFAAVSFAEVRSRLQEPQDAAFLAADVAPWVEFCRQALVRLAALDCARRNSCGVLKPSAIRRFSAWLEHGIAPRNLAGLADPARNNLYPLDLEVLIERASLLGLSRAELIAALPRLRGDFVP